MISEAFARKQLERLSQLTGFNWLMKEALTDMRLAIQAADTEAIATRVISDFCGDSSESCPTASAVRRAMNNENERGIAPETRPEVSFRSCDFCEGTGWIHVTHGRYSGVKECGCRRARIEAQEKTK